MKSLKLVCMAMLSMAMIMTSCSGEDGETGPQGDPGADSTVPGPQGPAGDDGISCWDLNGNGIGDADEDINQDGNFDAQDCQGESGEQGEDGNANVIAIEDLFIQDVSIGSIYQFQIDQITGIPVEELPNYSFLFYLKSASLNMYPVPGHLINNDHYARIYYNEGNGDGELSFFNTSDDSPYVVPIAEYFSLTIIAIEHSTLGNKNGSNDIMAELKAAGVDTSDYNAVATYFGLE
ncbi:collagen-like protein [Muricauda ruestringensis]|uniref:collagen-like protein n=1 Tax=Flagellimonas TaxID=444459 RepID=UPI001CD3B565|nr:MULTISPECIES: collagen-like protein [Allomuricauda]MCA0958554.1 collagen-like protein [Allomuricauda ruestringensis]USD26739.1 collagen-like protein [Allomuricauda aquimarina]